MAESKRRSLVEGLDPILLGAWLALACFGLAMILTASSLSADAIYGDALHFVTRQLSGLALGVMGGLALWFMPVTWLRKLAIPVFVISLVTCLLVVTPLGREVNGAQRWISLGFINLQPSELVKIGLCFAMADYLARNEGRLQDFMGSVVPGMLFPLLAVVAILPQKDFGTTVLLLGMTGVCFFVAGLPVRLLVLGGAGAVAGLAGLIVAEPYRLRRIASFTNPFEDPDGAGYQVVQGWIALATGGLSGTGLSNGVAQRGFLPEAHTDFISAVVGEELGTVGWVALVALQLLIVWRGMSVANKAPDLWSMVLAAGLTSLLGAQAIINLGVVSGVFPNKGLVLPFMSYGASAVMAHTLIIAVLLRLGRESGVSVALPPAPTATGLAARLRAVSPSARA